MSDRSKRCATCGRPRGLEQRRAGFRLHPKPYVPRTDNPEDTPWQIANDLICSVSVYRNGGAGDDAHLCNECLRIALRVIKNEIVELLGEIDEGHDKDVEIATLTERLANTQYRLHLVVFEHNRMQERLREILPHVSKSANREAVEMAEWEATRPPAKDGCDG